MLSEAEFISKATKTSIEGKTIVSFGSGNGMNEIALLEAGAACVHACEMQQESIKIAQRNLQKREQLKKTSYSDRITFFNTTFQKFFQQHGKNNKYDLAVVFLMCMQPREMIQMLNISGKMIKNGGKVLFGISEERDNTVHRNFSKNVGKYFKQAKGHKLDYYGYLEYSLPKALAGLKNPQTERIAATMLLSVMNYLIEGDYHLTNDYVYVCQKPNKHAAKKPSRPTLTLENDKLSMAVDLCLGHDRKIKIIDKIQQGLWEHKEYREGQGK